MTQHPDADLGQYADHLARHAIGEEALCGVSRLIVHREHGDALNVGGPGRRRIAGDEGTIEVLSPPVTNLKPRSYNVKVRAYAAPDRKQLIATHTQLCESLVDERDVLR